jgi:hypothetical protein
MSEASERPLNADQAKRLAELLETLPRKATGDRRWDLLQRRLNQALYSAHTGRKKNAPTVAETDAILDGLAQRLLDTAPQSPDPVQEQAAGDISEAIRDARDFLGVVKRRRV